MISHRDIRQQYSSFWEQDPRKHIKIDPTPLVLQNDATTLFNSSGMQPLVPYLSGETHPQGKRLYNIQPCIRTQDIDEVGNNRHTTFFEMIGNWSLGDYFKEEQLSWKWEFLTKRLGIKSEKLYVTVFEGGKEIPKDEESIKIWKKLGVKEDHLYEYGFDKNWWSRSGPPEIMPIGEIGGPSSEVFYDFGISHNNAFGKDCHPNCDCGRFIEICNSVFIEYKKNAEGKLIKLKQKNVDFGGGLERILSAANNDPDVFNSDLFSPIIEQIQDQLRLEYRSEQEKQSMRIIADHLKAASFLIMYGVTPSNKQQGYVLRRLLRRAAVKIYQFISHIEVDLASIINNGIVTVYKEVYPLIEENKGVINESIRHEMQKFQETLNRGMYIFKKSTHIDEKLAFDMYQSYGFPFEVTQELALQKGMQLDIKLYEEEFNKHKNLSRTASSGTFKGGLADHSGQVIKYHTATHLLHQALKDVFGNNTRQEGSNITSERLRFDVQLPHKPTEEQVKDVEMIINGKISEALPVYFKIMPRSEADNIGAASFFKEKYGDTVKVYFIGGTINESQNAYSKEFCGGPHVENTSEIGNIKIVKVKKIGDGLIRFYLE